MRPISLRTYIVAFVISVALFSFGILAGVLVTQNINQGLAEELQVLKSRSGEMELLLLLNASPETLCPFYKEQLLKFDSQTTEFGLKLGVLENARGKGDEEVAKLKRDYMVQQIRDFLLVQKINGQCSERISTLLYFYTSPCAECTEQGKVGPPLKQKHPGLMIYAFDVDLGVAAVDALRKAYSITEYPSLVLNGETLEGFQSMGKIESFLGG
ncbi:hypothetical protein HZC09_02190 [Candidatus Micrarchaeota archaeon]|nr:hypothetical protein [Candidatus Micrarchaeota archaeon]